MLPFLVESQPLVPRDGAGCVFDIQHRHDLGVHDSGRYRRGSTIELLRGAEGERAASSRCTVGVGSGVAGWFGQRRAAARAPRSSRQSWPSESRRGIMAVKLIVVAALVAAGIVGVVSARPAQGDPGQTLRFVAAPRRTTSFSIRPSRPEVPSGARCRTRRLGPGNGGTQGPDGKGCRTGYRAPPGQTGRGPSGRGSHLHSPGRHLSSPEKRTEIANLAQADLFVSVHAIGLRRISSAPGAMRGNAWTDCAIGPP